MAIFTWVNIMMTAIVSGNATVDQVLFSLELGVLVALFCNSVMRVPLSEHITRLMNGEYNSTGYGRLIRNLSLVVVPISIILTVMYVTLQQDISVDRPTWHYYISLDCNYFSWSLMEFISAFSEEEVKIYPMNKITKCFNEIGCYLI